MSGAKAARTKQSFWETLGAASGSYRRLYSYLKPYKVRFILGLVLSVGGIAINEYIVPPAGKRLHNLEEQVKVILKGRVIEDMTDQKAFIIQDFEGGRLARVVIGKD